MRNAQIPDHVVHLDALERYRESKVHFVGCTVAAMAAAPHVSVATFETAADQFEKIEFDYDDEHAHKHDKERQIAALVELKHC